MGSAAEGFSLGGVPVGGAAPCFVVAEAGQNHQGCLETAKKLISAARECGANCVKFQKTCISEKFNEAALAREYRSPHSWGKTYGEHKEYLEFSVEDILQLQKYASDVGILFTASAMDQSSVDVLAKMSVPFIKIGSGDSNNIPMIEYAASKHIPLIISTGMIDKTDAEKIYKTVMKYHSKFCLLHCVSSYPTPFNECNLNVIKDYQRAFPDVNIGYSGHEEGITVSLAAVALGAKVIERHFTLDKTLKGSDHCCSLLPNEMADLIRQIRIIESALGNPIKKVSPSEITCINKLQKSLTTANPLKADHILQKDDIKIKVTEPKGMNAIYYEAVLGKKLIKDKLNDEPIFETDFISW